MKALLTIKHLTIEAYDDGAWKPIVKGVDLRLARGEVLGLIGESGAGKSTLGLAAMGYTRPGCRITAGSIVFDGLELTQTSEDVKRHLRGARVAYVAQSAAASFNPAHRLIDQCAEGPVQHGLMRLAEAHQKAKDWYRRLDLPQPERIGYRYPHQVSGGQLQRAMVAMALATTPDLIVFDEPTTALDVITQIEVLAAIKEAVKQLRTAALYITHDLPVVAQLADRIMVLRDGDLIEENVTQDLLAHPEQDYTRRLLSVRSFRKAKPQAVQDDSIILHLQNLSAGYTKQVPVLDQINLRVKRRTTVAVVGESGSGKTSLARAITGLLPASQGTIMFDGQQLSPAMKSRQRDSLRRLQMIYQMPDVALNPRQQIHQILGRPLAFYFGMSGDERDATVRELLDMIELPATYMNRYPFELSGGEKQRICIARTLAAKPDLIICDEVTSALDLLVAEEILQLLQNLQNNLDVSYLFITHDLATVKAIADEVVIMLNGKIVEQGDKQEILTPPHHEYTNLLLSSVPEMDPHWLDNLLKHRQAHEAP
ncbi:Glutathione import ATP-binding protein GsiA [Candidatus Entotheonellaceae bacterium PAL068K]